MLTSELKVYKDMVTLTNKVLDAREHFSKGFKYAFGDRLLITALDCCELIQFANMDRAKRFQYLTDFTAKFGTLRLMLSICRDRRQISLTETTDLILLVDEIGKEITGWKKSSLKPES